MARAQEQLVARSGLIELPTRVHLAYLQVYARVPTGWGYAGHNLWLKSAVELGIFGVGLLFAGSASQFTMLKHIDTLGCAERSPHRPAALVAPCHSSIFVNDIMYEKYAWLIFSAMTLLRSRFIVGVHEVAADANDILDRSHAAFATGSSRRLTFGRDPRHNHLVP